MTISWGVYQYPVNGIVVNYYQSSLIQNATILPILFFFHAMWLDGATLIEDVGPLAEHYSIVLPDTRCHGRSQPVPKGTFKMKTLVEDAVGLIRHVGEGAPIYLMGTSMGAAIASRVAKEFPSLVKALILEEPPWARYPFEPLNFTEIDPSTHTSMPEYVNYLQSLSDSEFEKLDLLGKGLIAPAHSLLAAWKLFDLKDCRDTLVNVDAADLTAVAGIDVPTLIQIGDRNSTGTQVNGSKTNPDIAYSIINTYKNGIVSFYKDGNHVLHEAPTAAKWYLEVLGFFASSW